MRLLQPPDRCHLLPCRFRQALLYCDQHVHAVNALSGKTPPLTDLRPLLHRQPRPLAGVAPIHYCSFSRYAVGTFDERLINRVCNVLLPEIQELVPGMRPGGAPIPNFFMPMVQQGQRPGGRRARVWSLSM
ncbi:hypothetical protein L1987_32793 [Smallanthus sonchifolius]|uniref:Uncharacterized protein n=1 Tax=Smallanthus sonchifolius TaxID=185202 RepID=A0ACB9HP95_9ASTR|nr:hypothetical protein L1987_32793 [Smallanthus sonchifolius]